MSFDYLTAESTPSFTCPDVRIASVLFNPSKQQFRLIAHPGIGKVRTLIEEHAKHRMEVHWHALMHPVKQSPVIRFFQSHSANRLWVPSHVLRESIGETTKQRIYSMLDGVTIDAQRELVARYKPSAIQEMLALYQDQPNEDMTGYRYFMRLLDASASAEVFFGTLVDNVFTEIQDVDYRLGTPRTGFHQARSFELLGMAVARQWLLFPFVHHSSGLPEHYILSHRENVAKYFSQPYRPIEIENLLAMLKALPATSSTHSKFAIHFRNLVVCSTFRDIRQCSRELFETCLEVMAESERPMVKQNIGMARRTYNALLKVYNSQAEKGYLLNGVFPRRERVTVAEFASFQHMRDLDPKWEAWATAFEGFVAGTPDTQGQVRKTACTEFANFLVAHPNPPMMPELATRGLINDYDDGSPTYRNCLKRSESSAETCNHRLGFVSNFFDYVRDKALGADAHPKTDGTWFPNPVDMQFDRFEMRYRAGTHRKAISGHIMQMMRTVLVENDYEWPKAVFGSDWATLVNNDTGAIERVWCPSATILLYVLLSIPLRSLQGRLLDSGEGDAEIFDFETGQMIPNPRQLPVNGKLDPRRREGVLQIMASGMRDITDIVGLWISTNKTSDTGYAIPWISDELMSQLKYQLEFIGRYAQHPQTHGVAEAQGHRNAPHEWVERQPKFYCLFRDPSAENTAAPSLPVSKQKLLKLWGYLCQEVQRRQNENASTGERIRLVNPNTSSDRWPKALFDIHTLRVSGITDLLDRGVPLNIVSEYVAGHATYIMSLWYDKPSLGAIRDYLMKARQAAGDRAGPLPQFSQDELEEMKPFLIDHPDHRGIYTGFDALVENKGLILFRLSGICPGTQCSEGGLDEKQRAIPVPVGDRGPSCPQCRFWLTGPAFLLGQAIEGNQLILKIRNKIQSLANLRERVMDAEDTRDIRRADLLRGQTEIEERQLNDMLSEWWHRMRFYEASIAKLDAYRQYERNNDRGAAGVAEQPIALLSKASEADIRYSFTQATELELKHFLSTCAEFLPEFSLEPTGARHDIELAIGRFLAINDERDLTAMFFKLNDQQRLTAANLAVELMLGAASPKQVTELIEGKLELAAIPDLQRDIASMLAHSQSKAFTLIDCETLAIDDPA